MSEDGVHRNDNDTGPPTVGEEPWEAQVSALLGRLPLVEPPPGFIPRAADRRPLFAARMSVALVGASILALVVASGSGSFDEPATASQPGSTSIRTSSSAVALLNNRTGSGPFEELLSGVNSEDLLGEVDSDGFFDGVNSAASAVCTELGFPG